jgi:hypothetical protein
VGAILEFGLFADIMRNFAGLRLATRVYEDESNISSKLKALAQEAIAFVLISKS